MCLSVVIPAYRAAATLPRTLRSCLASVAAQDVHVALDGPDSALEAAARGAGEVGVAILPPRSGAPACRNAGLRAARREHVMFLDADDYVEGDFLADAVGVARASGADLVLGRFAFETPDGKRLLRDPRDVYGAPDAAAILEHWLRKRYTPPCAVVWRADFVRALGGWDETLAKNQDGDLIYRALLAGARVAFAREGLGVYVQSDDPGRITRQQTPAALASQLAVLDKLRAERRRFARSAVEALALAYYDIARHAYTAGEEETGRRAETRARDLGLRGEPGALPHAALAWLLGLRRKQRFTRGLRLALASATRVGATVRTGI